MGGDSGSLEGPSPQVWECARSQIEAEEACTHTHMRAPVLSGGEIQTRLIPSAFVGPTKAWLQPFFGPGT